MFTSIVIGRQIRGKIRAASLAAADGMNRTCVLTSSIYRNAPDPRAWFVKIPPTPDVSFEAQVYSAEFEELSSLSVCVSDNQHVFWLLRRAWLGAHRLTASRVDTPSSGTPDDLPTHESIH